MTPIDGNAVVGCELLLHSWQGEAVTIIDARALPPIPGSQGMGTWADVHATATSVSARGWTPSQALLAASLDGYRAECAEAGISRAAITARSANDLWGGLDSAAVLDAAKDSFYIPIAAVAADDDDPGSTAQGAIAAGAMAFVIEPTLAVPPRRLDDRRNFDAYEACAESGLPLYLMVGGESGPDLSYSDPLALEQVAIAFPHTRIVCIHAGWPFVTTMLGVCWRRENVWLLPDVYFPGLPGQEDYVRAAETYLQDRLLFASAWPYAPLPQLVRAYEGLGLTDAVLEKVFHRNAAHLFELAP